jgi:hypothetical protein
VSTEADVIAAAPSFRRATEDPYPDYEFDDMKMTGEASCAYWVKLGELDAALDVIDGLEEDVTISTSPLITVRRNVPLVHYRYSILMAYSRRVIEYPSIEDPVSGIDFTGPQAKILVRFGAPQWSPQASTPDQRLIIRGNVREDAAPGAVFEGGGFPSHEVSQLNPGGSYILTVFDAPNMTEAQEAYLLSMNGRTNLDTFRNNPTGTVLYTSPQVDYTLKRDGSTTCTYSLQLDVKNRDWNLERKRDGSLAKIMIDGAYRHPYLDFSTLFV